MLNEERSIDLCEVEAKYLLRLYTGRKEDEDLIQSKGVVYPSQITADDKIYVFPGCSIKKLPLRKWIK